MAKPINVDYGTDPTLFLTNKLIISVPTGSYTSRYSPAWSIQQSRIA